MTGVSRIIGGFLQMGYSVAGRYIPRRLLLGGSNLAISLGCLMMGIADRFSGLLFGNVTAGVGQAGEHPLGTSILTQKFEKNGVAGALSTFYGFGYIGNIISPLLLSSISVLLGWRFSYFFLALIPLITGLIVLSYLRNEPASGKTQVIDGNGNLLNEIKSSLKISGAPFILIAQGFIVGGTGMGVIITWIPQFLRDASKGLGLSIMEAGIIGAVSTLGGVIGTIVVGRLAERFGYLRTAIVCICSTIISIYLLTFYSEFTFILVLHLFFAGVTTFSISSLLQAQLATMSSSSQKDVLLGLFFTVGFGLSSLWSTIMGLLIDAYSFDAIWTMMSSLGLVALFMLINAHHRIS
jgi:predicted MFS family arabinose efflux permease